MRIKLGMLYVVLFMPGIGFAQTLGGIQGNSVEISSVGGTTPANNFRNKTWLYRSTNGSDWLSARLHDAISIDASFVVPQIDTRTWWERDPYNNVQSWGHAATTHMILNQGKLGLGTLVPEAFLNVVGNSGSVVEIKADHYVNNFGSSTIQMRKARGTKAAPLVVAVGDYVGSWETWAYSGSSFIRNSYIGSLVTGTPSASGIATDLIFATNPGGVPDALEGMRLDKNGNLGIGTITPTEKLSVKGKIRAQEVKVEMANWPDFVFDKSYKLPTLQETEKHIKEKRHLPGIPSAAEVEKNGIELGDMNKKLLQKIEELTLYLIEQNKVQQIQLEQLKKQEKHIADLARQITGLKTIK